MLVHVVEEEGLSEDAIGEVAGRKRYTCKSILRIRDLNEGAALIDENAIRGPSLQQERL